MGFVCDNSDTATYLREASDRILSSIQEGTYFFDNLEEHQLLGILTLENVIERMLKMNIHDEKDHDAQMRIDMNLTTMKNDLTTSLVLGGANLLRRGKSIHYDMPETEEEIVRTASTNQVFQSKFMLKFSANLESVIRTDIIDESNKTETMLRSLSTIVED